MATKCAKINSWFWLKVKIQVKNVATCDSINVILCYSVTIYHCATYKNVLRSSNTDPQKLKVRFLSCPLCEELTVDQLNTINTRTDRSPM